MGVHCYNEGDSWIRSHLIDGLLPERSKLIQLAKKVTEECPEDNKSRLCSLPYFWDKADSDDIFSRAAFNIRGLYCGNRPEGDSQTKWTECWLVNPNKWDEEFTLKNNKYNTPDRRLLIALYCECKQGTACLSNLTTQTSFKVIPDTHYKDLKAFKRKSEEILDDISLPFRAPCLIAAERMESRGYQFEEIGG